MQTVLLGVVERPVDSFLFPPAALSRRQREVLDLIVQGMTNMEIAHSLGLSKGTVKIHVAALFGKLGVRRRAAVAVAGARGSLWKVTNQLGSALST